MREHVANVTGPQGFAGSSPAPSAIQAVIVYCIYCILQIADGALTYIGMLRYGYFAEANLLVRHLMQTRGLIPTLVGVKLFALLLPLILPPTRLAYRMMILVCIFYALIAVVPWLYAFYTIPVA